MSRLCTVCSPHPHRGCTAVRPSSPSPALSFWPRPIARPAAFHPCLAHHLQHRTLTGQRLQSRNPWHGPASAAHFPHVKRPCPRGPLVLRWSDLRARASFNVATTNGVPRRVSDACHVICMLRGQVQFATESFCRTSMMMVIGPWMPHPGPSSAVAKCAAFQTDSPETPPLTSIRSFHHGTDPPARHPFA